MSTTIYREAGRVGADEDDEEMSNNITQGDVVSIRLVGRLRSFSHILAHRDMVK
jgi:hypothetical protein